MKYTSLKKRGDKKGCPLFLIMSNFNYLLKLLLITASIFVICVNADEEIERLHESVSQKPWSLTDLFRWPVFCGPGQALLNLTRPAHGPKIKKTRKRGPTRVDRP